LARLPNKIFEVNFFAVEIFGHASNIVHTSPLTPLRSRDAAYTTFKRLDLKVRLNVQQIKRNEKRKFLHYCDVGDALT